MIKHMAGPKKDIPQKANQVLQVQRPKTRLSHGTLGHVYRLMPKSRVDRTFCDFFSAPRFTQDPLPHLCPEPQSSPFRHVWAFAPTRE